MSAIKSSPITVTAIVYSAEGLKPKKKDKHKFCVIIGCGNQKFRTEIIEDLFDRPTFNTECEIPVDDVTQPLSFVVTEKNDKDVLGQVVVPLSELTTFRTNRKERAPLRAHKKCPQADGELVFEAWISAGTITSSMLATTVDEEVDDRRSSSSAMTGLKKLRDKLAHSPMLTRALAHVNEKKTSEKQKLIDALSCMQHIAAAAARDVDLRYCQEVADVEMLFRKETSQSQRKPEQSSSVSCQDLMTSFGYGTRLTVADVNKRRQSAASNNADAESVDGVDGAATTVVVGNGTKPEVTGVSPREGPCEGGTRLTIRGVNLGRNKDDVVGLLVCGSNVLSTLEYVSSSKLMCTTKAFRSCSGNIVVETQSGGRGLSLVQFTFLGATSATVEGGSDNISEASSSLSRSSSRGDADLKREGSQRSAGDRESAFSSSKFTSKARSMFDLSLSTKHTAAAVIPPEVTGVSPCDGPATSSTRLVIRGTNLGRSRADVVSVTVAGVNCTSSLEYESSTRLTCIAGPTPSRTACCGPVIVETKSGGVGVSTVQFSFVRSSGSNKIDANEWAAIPYDATAMTSSSAQSQSIAGETTYTETPPVSSLYLTVPTAPPRHSSADLTSSQQLSSQSASTTASSFVNTLNVQVVKQPPPVVEIQPMSRSSSSSAFTPVVVATSAVNNRKSTGSSSNKKSSAPLPPAVTPTGNISSQKVVENGQSNRTLSMQLTSAVIDNESKDTVTDLNRQLYQTTEHVKQLQVENKVLKDENERMRQYMENLVSRAIALCPQILCVDGVTGLP